MFADCAGLFNSRPVTSFVHRVFHGIDVPSGLPYLAVGCRCPSGRYPHRKHSAGLLCLCSFGIRTPGYLGWESAAARYACLAGILQDGHSCPPIRLWRAGMLPATFWLQWRCLGSPSSRAPSQSPGPVKKNSPGGPLCELHRAGRPPWENINCLVAGLQNRVRRPASGSASSNAPRYRLAAVRNFGNLCRSRGLGGI